MRVFANSGYASATLSIVARIWKEKLTTFGTANLAQRKVVLARVVVILLGPPHEYDT
jgi:hypothetical protein